MSTCTKLKPYLWFIAIWAMSLVGFASVIYLLKMVFKLLLT